MKLLLEIKGQWVYAKTSTGAEVTPSEKLAFIFKEKEAEKVKQELENLGLNVRIEQ